jgi:hypothetical protein
MTIHHIDRREVQFECDVCHRFTEPFVPVPGEGPAGWTKRSSGGGGRPVQDLCDECTAELRENGGKSTPPPSGS